MVANNYITKAVTIIMAAAVCICLCAMGFSERFVSAFGGTGVTLEYESKLFDTDEIISINIMMDDDEWSELLADAIEEKYYRCDVEINGEVFYNVGIRPKGNTSLSAIANDPDTDRYSLKLEFDQYEEGQTCYGLDKLILNNNYADATNMKEALVYDMFHYIDADASLYNYAEISVNGKYWGVYLALEAVEDSFMLRNYGAEGGELYKPDGMDFGGMGRGNGGGMGGGGSNLNYTDDNLDSYSTIWNCEVTDTSESDHERVVAALKNISQGTDLESCMDIDNLLKYAAVHILSVNADSLSGTMAHNYYLYESGGKLNLLPWDYNLSFGGMGGFGRNGSGATSTVNAPIDDAFAGTEFFDTLLADEEYHAQYYAYLQQLVDEYLLGDGFEQFYNRTRSQIDELVKTDPNALYTYEEYTAALETLCEVAELRGKSIAGQIDGIIPSTDSEQNNSDALIDASHLDLSVMGSMDMDGGRGAADRQEVNGAIPAQAGVHPPGSFEPPRGGGEMPGNDQSDNIARNLTEYGICFAVLIAALIFAVLFKRKPRRL